MSRTMLCMTQDAAKLTPREAADRLAARGVSVHPETLKRWAKRGQVPAVKLPSGRLLFAPDDIDALASPSEQVAS